MLILLPMPIRTFCDYNSNSDSNRPGFDSNSQVETGIHTSLAEKQSKWKIGFASYLGIQQFFSQSLSIAYFAERARLTKPQQSYCRSYLPANNNRTELQEDQQHCNCAPRPHQHINILNFSYTYNEIQIKRDILTLCTSFVLPSINAGSETQKIT